MNDGPLLAPGRVREALEALRSDLRADGGPRISTMRNHRFAILPYPPALEFQLRRGVARLSDELRREGWQVREISLQRLVLDRVAALPVDVRRSITERESRLHQRDPARALNYLKEQLVPLLEGPDGLALDVARALDALVAEYPDAQDRSVVFLTRVSALYPFTRASALLKHIAGRTRHLPVVLLYPGERHDEGLSFLGQLTADRDYRPRIYP